MRRIASNAFSASAGVVTSRGRTYGPLTFAFAPSITRVPTVPSHEQSYLPAATTGLTCNDVLGDPSHPWCEE